MRPRKLNDEQADELHNFYALRKTLTDHALALRYGVSVDTIRRYVNRVLRRKCAEGSVQEVIVTGSDAS